MLEALPTDAFAQSPVCHAIRRGESATQAARRMTGNGRNAYQASFQIMNPSSRFVPKSQYDRIRAGWRACVMPAIRNLSSTANHVEEPEAADVIQSLPTAPVFPDYSRRPRHSRAPTPSTAPAMARSPQPPTSFARSGVSISRCCGLALRWLCRGSGGGSSTTISLAGRRRPSSCGTLPIDSSMSSNGHWFGTTPGASREIASPLRRAAWAIRHSSRAGRGKALSEPVGPQEERRIRRGPGDARARR